jgi:hypothetical protein
MPDRTKIIELNDLLRTSFKGGRVQMTPGVYALGSQIRGRALYALSKYSKFSDDDERNWGVFIFAGYAFEWQIEYRANDHGGLSSDPENPEKTLRVLTLYVVDDMLH